MLEDCKQLGICDIIQYIFVVFLPVCVNIINDSPYNHHTQPLFLLDTDGFIKCFGHMTIIKRKLLLTLYGSTTIIYNVYSIIFCLQF
jgi:hypothetical protein